MSWKKKIFRNTDFSDTHEEMKVKVNIDKKTGFWNWVLFSPTAATTLLKMSRLFPALIFAIAGGYLFYQGFVTNFGFFVGGAVCFIIAMYNMKKWWDIRDIPSSTGNVWELLWHEKEEESQEEDKNENKKKKVIISETRDPLWDE